MVIRTTHVAEGDLSTRGLAEWLRLRGRSELGA
jgi:hypothetical protein